MSSISIDVSGWGAYKIGDLFEVSRPPARSLKNYLSGDVPFVASGNFNNGVVELVEPLPGEQVDCGNCLTVSPLDGATFYQPVDFLGRGGAGSAIIVLRNNQLTPLRGLFLANVVRHSLTQFNYSNQLNSKSIADQTIKIPVLNDAPDWNLMEQMMGAAMGDQEGRLSLVETLANLTPVAVDTHTWADFRIDKIFNVVKGSRLKSTDRIPGDIPYVGASQFNNGITHYIGNDERIHSGGVLTVCYNGPVGTTFYQPNDFWATDDVNVLYPLFKISPETLLFIAPIIEQVGKNYAYVDKWKLADMKAAVIKLPVDAAGAPDWVYMESTMKDLLEQKASDLDVLQKLLPQSEELEVI